MKTLFDYRDGSLYNKISRGAAMKDTLAGYISQDGYRRVTIDLKTHYIHRIVYEMHFGVIPESLFIDHIDGDRLNNSINNLRVVSARQNQYNKSKQRSTTSSYKGVWFDKNRNKWKASFRFPDKRVYLGQFESEIDAAEAYNFYAKEVHGDYARLNVIGE